MIKRLYERWILNPKARRIARDIRSNPQAWLTDGLYITKHPATLSRGNLAIWTANGWWFVGIYEPKCEKLGIVGRTLVWLAAKKVISNEKSFNKNVNERTMREIGL